MSDGCDIEVSELARQVAAATAQDPVMIELLLRVESLLKSQVIALQQDVLACALWRAHQRALPVDIGVLELRDGGRRREVLLEPSLRRQRCSARESGGVQCELPDGQEGAHACPEALARSERGG